MTEQKPEQKPEQKRIGVGVGVMLVRDGRVLLGKRHEDPAKAGSALNGAGTWTMPGGKLRFGESFEDAARRETLEETGLVIGRVEIIALNNDTIEDAHFVTIGLFSEDFDGEPEVREPDAITCWEWFDFGDLPSPLYFPSEKVLKNYRQSRFYISRE